MIFNTLEEIVALIKAPRNAELIEEGREIKEKHQLHLAGEGLDEWLKKIEGIENTDYLSLRKALANEATVPVMSQTLITQNKVFNAKGGANLYDFSNDYDKATFANEYLSNVSKGMSLRTFMQKRWSTLVNIDPCGLLFVELKADGTTELTYKCIDKIRDYDYQTPTQLDYVIFEPYTVKDGDGSKYYRVVDDATDYLVKCKDDTYSIIDDKSYINYFGRVPACIISDNIDRIENYFTTYVADSMCLCDDYLLDYTLYKIYKTKQAIPYVWEYERNCHVCNGVGRNKVGETCGACNGSGVAKNRTVADVILVPLPKQGETEITPPAGYVQADVTYVKTQEETQDRYKRMIYEAVWGNSASVDKLQKDRTAFEVSVTKESEKDKLEAISMNAESVEKAITELLGRFYYPNTFTDCSINYGRQYSVYSADDYYAAYVDGVKNGMDDTLLTAMLENYYSALYYTSPLELNAALIPVKTKPFYHYSPDKLKNMGVPQLDYYKNIYYNQFRAEYEQKRPFAISTIDEVNAALEAYVVAKGVMTAVEPSPSPIQATV